MFLDALSSGGGHEDLACRSLPGDPSGYIDDRSQGGEDPTRPGTGSQLACAYQGQPAVDPHMKRHRIGNAGELLVQFFHLALDGKRAPNGIKGVLSGGSIILENYHESVPGGFVHVPVIVMDNIEEGGEISLEQPVKLFGLHLLGEMSVTGDVEKYCGDVFFALFELGSLRILLQHSLHRLGHELR